VVGFVAQGVAEHLADSGELVLAVEAQDHAEEAVELGAFHALAEKEHVLGQLLLVAGVGKVESRRRSRLLFTTRLFLALIVGDILEHGLAFVRVEAKGADHVDKAVGMDVFLMGMPAEDQLQFRGGDDFAGDMQDVVPDNPLGRAEIADRHLDDPAVDVGDFAGGVAPLLDILLHRNVFRLPVVGLHRLVGFVGPLVLQGQDVEEHRVLAIDDFLGREGLFGLALVEGEFLAHGR
jgi:hypothetical protein